MSSSPNNVSVVITNFVLVGLIEIESFRYVCALLALALFLVTLFVGSMIVYVTWTEKNLHEPMYIFICILVVNVMLGNASYFPKLAIDLLSGCSTISLAECLCQSFCIQLYAWVEMFTFTVMAYDRYLAVGHPLRYHTLMTNITTQKISLAVYVFNVIRVTVGVLLTSRLTFCEVNINNVFCEIMSLQPLACNDITINVLFGKTLTLSSVIGCLLVITYCYIRTVVICLKLSAESSQKALHTLMTHVLAFSIYAVTFLFVNLRYRLNWGSVSMQVDVIIPLIGTSIAITVNPLIYGIRTKALREKILCNVQKIVG
ncbi:olfactory receptor 51E1-like [Rana temporaria]|uniref:olfactory receptor 51E1-like n=1 Tax=Rana temporaria TaxID=8407 RepID=UPI001AAC8427|nr:olfactory receptor 51E1-like [Rana temporaria]